MYLALSIVFLIFSLALTAGIILTTVLSQKNGGELITKKNLFYVVPTFVLIYLLHVTASAYNGAKFDFFYCFSLIDTVLDVFKFSAKEELLLPLCTAYPVFYADFVLAFIAGEASVILSVASFFSRRIANRISVNSALKKNCDLVVGDTETAVKYVKNNNGSILLGIDLSSQRYADLIKQGVPVLKLASGTEAVAKKLKRGGYNIIVFRDGEYAYTKILEFFGGLNGNKIFLEANQAEMKILKEKFITKADDNANLHLTGFSKYELMARRFVTDYPVTKYIPRSFYNENCTLKNDKQINIVFVGFGKVNYQLFRMCAMQFQFAKEEGGRLASAPVHYYIFDKKEKGVHNEFFSHILYEFDEEFKDCDFPKPEKICEIDVDNLDINSVEAKKKFKSLVGKDSFTYFVVSLDKDLEDASYAQTVRRLFGDDANYRIFVRAKNYGGEKLNELSDKIIYFGEEKLLYTHANIVNDDLTELAQRINLLYNTIANPPEWLKTIKDNKGLTAEEQRRMLNAALVDFNHREYMLDRWAELPYIEKSSNLYHALNLPFKLNLLGYDMVKKQGDNDCGISEAEFNERYINSGRDTGYADYSYFFKTEASNVLAYIEHLRWNALYILYDYKQMKKSRYEGGGQWRSKGNAAQKYGVKAARLHNHLLRA